MAIKFLNSVNADSGVLYVDATNNRVGIGTTSPSTKFSVSNKFIINDDAVASWGPAADYGRLSWDTGKAILYGLSGKRLALGANGTKEHVTIATGGNVGIGTTAPTATLHVGIGSGLSSLSVNDPYIMLGLASSVNMAFDTNEIQVRDNGVADNLLLQKNGGNVGIGTASPSYKLEVEDTIGIKRLGVAATSTIQQTGAGFTINAPSGYHSLIVQNNGTEYARVNSSGNVGIGTTSPLYKLDVASGNSSSAFGLSLSGTARLKMYADGTYNYFAAQSGQSHRFTTTGGAEFLISNGGNVGIGTTSPGNKLHIKAGASGFAGTFDSRYKSIVEASGEAYYATYVPDNSYSGIRFNNTSGLRGFIDYYHGTQGDALVYSAGNHHRFLTNGVERVRLIQNGYLGIGTTSPATKLEVNGDIGIGRVAGGYTFRETVGGGLRASMKSNASNELIFSYGADSEAMRINSAGNIGIGESQPAYKLHVAGTFRASGNSSIGGNLGIGTNSPDSKLEVAGGTTGILLSNLGDSSAYDAIRMTYSGYNSGTPEFIFQPKTAPGSGTVNSYFRFQTKPNGGAAGTGNVANVTIDGNLGIGTTSPAQKLHVVGTSNFQGAVQVAGGTFVDSARRNIYIDSFSAGGGAGIFFRDGFAYNASITAEDHNGSSADGICISGYDGVSFSTGANTRQERMRIHTNGNVGIGTTSPAEKLEVNGNIKGSILYATDDIVVADKIIHYGDTDTYFQFDANRIRLIAGSATKFDSNNTYVVDTTPASPSITSTSVVGETIEVVFNASATADIDYYQVWSSVAGGSFDLIAQIPESDFASSMTVIDASFSISGTMSYRVYAVKNGRYSSPATDSQAISAPTLDVGSLSVVNLNTAYYIQYNMPESRFVDHVEIYMDSEAVQGNLTRTGATLVYSGNNTSFMHSVGVTDNYHQFWVEVVES